MYQHTTAEQFRRLISDECVNVAKEEMVLDSVLEWVRYDVENRARHLPELLSAVQWPLVRNRAALREALKDPLIAACPESVGLVEAAVKYHKMSYANKVEYWRGKDRPSRQERHDSKQRYSTGCPICSWTFINLPH